MKTTNELETKHGRIEDLDSLLETIREMEAREGEGLHLTLYCKAGSHPEESEKAPIRFKNLIAEADLRLADCGVGEDERKRWLEPLRKIVEDSVFWRNQHGGIAVFGLNGSLWIYEVNTGLECSVEVRRHFWLKPLMAAAANSDQYYMLCLSQAEAKLYRGGDFGVEEVDSPGMPKGYGGAMERIGYDADTKAMAGAESHVKADERYLKQYFEQVDEAVRHAILKDGIAAPLVLAAVKEYAPYYREVNQYDGLSDSVITGNPEHEDLRDLGQKAKNLLSRELDETQRERLKLFSDAYAGGDGLKLEGVEEVIEAAVQGRVETLFVPSDASYWGCYSDDDTTIKVGEDAGDSSEATDLYELAARKTLDTGGEVFFLEKAKLPTESKVVAIARWERQAVNA